MNIKLSASAFSGIDTQKVVVHDFSIVAGSDNQLAEVVISAANGLAGLNLLGKLQAALDNAATPISGSFRYLDDDVSKTTRLLSGFVAMVPAVYAIESRHELIKAGFKLTAKNMYMDDSDHAWELKSGEAGEYLVRTSADELPAVLQAAKQKANSYQVSRMQSSVSNLEPVKTHTGEFAAFVTPEAHLDYGFVVGASKKTGDIAIVSFTHQDKALVHPSMIIESEAVKLPASVQNNPKVGPLPGATDTNRINAAKIDAQNMIDYYRKAYQHSSSYIQKIIEQIEAQAAA